MVAIAIGSNCLCNLFPLAKILQEKKEQEQVLLKYYINKQLLIFLDNLLIKKAKYMYDLILSNSSRIENISFVTMYFSKLFFNWKT